MCLDECTANVDPQTTALLKKTVAKECANMTVITIAHRISTITDLHRVLIIEQGRLVRTFFSLQQQIRLCLLLTQFSYRQLVYNILQNLQMKIMYILYITRNFRNISTHQRKLLSNLRRPVLFPGQVKYDFNSF